MCWMSDLLLLLAHMHVPWRGAAGARRFAQRDGWRERKWNRGEETNNEECPKLRELVDGSRNCRRGNIAAKKKVGGIGTTFRYTHYSAKYCEAVILRTFAIAAACHSTTALLAKEGREKCKIDGGGIGIAGGSGNLMMNEGGTMGPRAGYIQRSSTWSDVRWSRIKAATAAATSRTERASEALMVRMLEVVSVMRVERISYTNGTVRMGKWGASDAERYTGGARTYDIWYRKRWRGSAWGMEEIRLEGS
ncbi:hypothetical protein C8J57DRAFT_1668537 [Mycena rebaudengoi]|nr:hypothetical protein C8J57DRAFT_1668537 [Mycena rebaudengoi]